jgi:hypothetical protein
MDLYNNRLGCCRPDSSGSEGGQIVDSVGDSEKPSDCIKCREYIKELRMYWFLKEDRAQWSYLLRELMFNEGHAVA